MEARALDRTTDVASEDIWSRNLRFLRLHCAEASWNAVRSAPTAAAPWRLAITRDRSGNREYRPQSAAGCGVPLHSVRDPHGEARRQVARWLEMNPIAPGRIIVVFGIAAGFHLHALAEWLDETNGLLVVDANPAVVADALHEADLTALGATRAKSLQFVIGADAERVFREFFDALSLWPRLDYSFFVHPGTQRAFAAVYDPMSHRFAEKVRVDMIQRSTVSSLTRGWLENAIRNLPCLLESSPLQSLKGAFAGIPAAVVAAGPTLAASLDLLRRLRDRALIVAVGTAYRPLCAAGIEPHLTILVDGSPLIARQFEGVSATVGRLLIPPQIHPDVVRLFRGRLVLWHSGALPEFRDWLALHAGAEADSLGAGGTVTYSAIEAARYLGCPRVYSFGLDLAFQDDGRTHVGNSMYDNCTHARDGLVPVTGNVRPQVWTTPQFATYIEMLAGLAASIAAAPDCELLNVNPDGARIPNMQHCLPGDLDASQFPDSLDCGARIAALCRAPLAPCTTLKTLLSETRKDLCDLEANARRAANLCRKLAKPGAQSAEQAPVWLQRLAKAEARLGRTSPGGLLLSAAVRASSMETIAFCAGIPAADENGFARVHEKCAAYYLELGRVIQWLRQELTDAGQSGCWSRQ